MGKRIFSTVLLWSLVGVVIWFFRTPGALVLVTLISVLTLRAFYALMHGAGRSPVRPMVRRRTRSRTKVSSSLRR